MAKSKKQTRNTDSANSPFWKPAPGDKIEGRFIGFQTTQANDEGQRGLAINLLLKNGTKLVNVTSQIKRMLADKVKGLKSGKTLVKIVFVDRVKIKKSRTFKKFRVWLDGKELEDVSNFNNTASPKDLANFFKS